jgi:hypothetical protein
VAMMADAIIFLIGSGSNRNQRGPSSDGLASIQPRQNKSTSISAIISRLSIVICDIRLQGIIVLVQPR